MKLVPAAVTAALLVGAPVALAGPAAATAAPGAPAVLTAGAITTTCSGSTAGVTVEGDLVVPGGQTCALSDVVVTGQTRLAEAAELTLTDSTLGGGVVLAADAYLDVTGSTVEGRVVNRGYGVAATDSSFGAAVVTTADADRPSSFVAVGTEVAGSVRASGAEVVLDGSRVGGDLRTDAGSYTDLFDSVVDGDLEVTGNAFGATTCESEVHGDAVYRGNDLGLQLGTTGPFATCSGQSVWGGDVVVDDNRGEVRFSGNIVRGDLSGDGNDPAPVGAGNRVRGTTAGQMVDLEPPAAPVGASEPAQAARADLVERLRPRW